MILKFPDRAGAPRREADSFTTALMAELPRLRRYAIALVGDVNLADDLLQDCVERALRRRSSLDEPQYLYAWLRSILHNLYVDDIRQSRRRGQHVDLEGVSDLLALSVPPSDRGVMIDFARAIGQLSLEHRQILLLVGLEGLSYREISDSLRVPLGTVMSRLARAREQLRLRRDGNVVDMSLRMTTAMPVRTAME